MTASPPSAPPTRRRRRWLRWLVAGVGVLVVAAVAGPFVYIHFIEGSAPAKLSLTPAATGSSSTGASSSGSTNPAAPMTGTWRVGTGSQVGYRVGENLFGQNTTAVGRTTDVTGQLVIDGTTVRSARFTVQMKTVHSDQSGRNAQFQGRIMDTSTYPTATFTLTQPISLGSIPTVGVIRAEQAVGRLTLRAETHQVTLALQTERTATGFEVLGDYDVVFADWGIPNPSFGPVSTNNHGLLELLLNFQRGAASVTTTPATSPSAGNGGAGGGGGGGGGGFSPPTLPATTLAPLKIPAG